MVFSLKHLSNDLSFVGGYFFRDLVIGTYGRLSVDLWSVRRLSADDRLTHFKLPDIERQRSMIGRQSADF